MQTLHLHLRLSTPLRKILMADHYLGVDYFCREL